MFISSRNYLKVILLFLGCFVYQQISAQEYYHSYGGGFSFILYDQETANGSFSGGTQNGGLSYNPMLNFEINRDLSFNAAAYPFIGLVFNSTVGGSLGVELPVVGELVVGDITGTSFFAGAGFNWAYAAGFFDGGSLLGPQGSVGGQFYFLDRLVKLRAGYTLGVIKPNKDNIEFTTDKRNALNLSLMYMLGI